MIHLYFMLVFDPLTVSLDNRMVVTPHLIVMDPSVLNVHQDLNHPPLMMQPVLRVLHILDQRH
jgi:hypothetical protein